MGKRHSALVMSGASDVADASRFPGCEPRSIERSLPEPAYSYRDLHRLLNRGAENTRAEVAESVGFDLLSYVADAAPPEVAAHLAGKRSLNDEQAEALDLALEFASLALDLRRESASNDDSRPGPRETPFEVLTELFGSRSRGSTLGFADALRVHAGGTLPQPPAATDAVTTILLSHARATYGALLVRPPRDAASPPWSLSRAGRLSLDREEWWRAALMEDSALSVMFPSLLTMVAGSRQYLDSSGQGGTLQAALLPELVVRTAARRAGWPESLDGDRYLEQVAAIVVELRRLVAGETVEVPAWVTLTGRDVPARFRLETLLGDVSAATQPGAWPFTAVPGTQLLLTITYPLNLEFDAPMGGGPLPTSVFAAQREFQRRIDHVRLAFLLALENSDPLALQVSSREISNPLSWSSINWPWSVPPFTLPLEERDSELVTSWCQTINRHHHPSIELAGRRALSAATPGRDSEDRLVDAVIGLDNLVGQGAGKPPSRAFKEAIAALFPDAPSGRQSLSERAHALYQARSEIVHGRRELGVVEAEELRKESLTLLVRALRRLFGERPELIPDRRRAGRLIGESRRDERSSSTST